jgi:hypothetical protein
MADDDTTQPSADGEASEIQSADRQKMIRMAQIGLVVLALLVVAVVLLTRGGDDEATDTSGGGDAAASAEPGKPEFPREVGGRPPALGTRGQTADEVAVDPAAPAGVYLWSDFDGWHLWVIAGEGLPQVTGTLTSNDQVTKAELAIAGTGEVSIEDKVVRFSMPADAPLAGIDFNPGFFAKDIVFTLTDPAGNPIDPTKIYVGSKAEQAPFPLVLTKAPR